MQYGQDIASLENGHGDFFAEDISCFAEVSGHSNGPRFSAVPTAAIDDLLIGPGIYGGAGQTVVGPGIDTGEKLTVAFKASCFSTGGIHSPSTSSEVLFSLFCFIKKSQLAFRQFFSDLRKNGVFF
jgi:hypothetical protein